MESIVCVIGQLGIYYTQFNFIDHTFYNTLLWATILKWKIIFIENKSIDQHSTVLLDSVVRKQLKCETALNSNLSNIQILELVLLVRDKYMYEYIYIYIYIYTIYKLYCIDL